MDALQFSGAEIAGSRSPSVLNDGEAPTNVQKQLFQALRLLFTLETSQAERCSLVAFSLSRPQCPNFFLRPDLTFAIVLNLVEAFAYSDNIVTYCQHSPLGSTLTVRMFLPEKGPLNCGSLPRFGHVGELDREVRQVAVRVDGWCSREVQNHRDCRVHCPRDLFEYSRWDHLRMLIDSTQIFKIVERPLDVADTVGQLLCNSFRCHDLDSFRIQGSLLRMLGQLVHHHRIL